MKKRKFLSEDGDEYPFKFRKGDRVRAQLGNGFQEGTIAEGVFDPKGRTAFYEIEVNGRYFAATEEQVELIHGAALHME